MDPHAHHIDPDPDSHCNKRIRILGSADPHQEKTDPDPALGERFRCVLFLLFTFFLVYISVFKEVNIIYYKSNEKIYKNLFFVPFTLAALYAIRIRFLRHDADPDPQHWI